MTKENFDIEDYVDQDHLNILIKVKALQCPKRKVEYVTSEVRNGLLQTWMVMDGIELSYMMYQDSYQPIFMCNRCADELDETYYFNTYAECLKIWEASNEELNTYLKSITI